MLKNCHTFVKQGELHSEITTPYGIVYRPRERFWRRHCFRREKCTIIKKEINNVRVYVYDVYTHDGTYIELENQWTKKKKLTGSFGIGTPREELYSMGLSLIQCASKFRRGADKTGWEKKLNKAFPPPVAYD